MLKEGQVRIPSGCAISGVFARDGQPISGEVIRRSIAVMHERSNGLGGGFAGYGIYPQYKNHYALHVFYDDLAAREECERFLERHFDVINLSKIPTRPTPKIKDAPLIWRYFVQPLPHKLADSHLDEKEYVARCVIRINDQLKAQWQDRVSQALTAIDHDDQVDVAFANRRWLATIYSVGFYYADAAHPSNGFTASTYDLSTGQAVDWSRWFRFTAPGAEPVDFDRRDLLAAQALKAFAAQVVELPPDKPADTSDQARCARLILAHYACQGSRCTSGELTGGRVPEGWQVWPTAQGLAVAPDVYAEVDRGCRGQAVTLPWAQARASLLRPQPLP